MNYLLWIPSAAGLNEGYLYKEGGTNATTRDPRLATAFDTKEDASNAKLGHSRDMGGSGRFYGRVVLAKSAISAWDSWERETYEMEQNT